MPRQQQPFPFVRSGWPTPFEICINADPYSGQLPTEEAPDWVSLRELILAYQILKEREKRSEEIKRLKRELFELRMPL